jgi:hypothetical protein
MAAVQVMHAPQAGQRGAVLAVAQRGAARCA